MRRLPSLFLALILSACGSCEAEEAKAPPDAKEPEAARTAPAVTSQCELPPSPESLRPVRADEDLVYATLDGAPLDVDVARPAEGEGPFPVALLFHGGAWKHGDEDHFQRTMRTLASRGWASASVAYRLAGTGRYDFPAPMSDVRCAVRWLAENASRYQLDLGRSVLVGASAGAHLAATLATVHNDAELDGQCATKGPLPRFSGLIAYHGIYDFRPEAGLDEPTRELVAKLLDGMPADQPERARLASPAAQVDDEVAPTLIVHGAEDRIAPVEGARAFRAALEDAGTPVTLVEVEGADHGFGLLERTPRYRTATCTTLAFLERIRRGGT